MRDGVEVPDAATGLFDRSESSRGSESSASEPRTLAVRSAWAGSESVDELSEVPLSSADPAGAESSLLVSSHESGTEPSSSRSPDFGSSARGNRRDPKADGR